ncbi:MAG: hypothetical protein WD873_04625, partial [Candidatus Hydrogenedentales bacterium]
MIPVRRAVLSCFNKHGIVEFAEGLREFGVELICTEGTQRALLEAGIESRSIADFIGVREMLSGRVKTLNPKIHAGLLGIRGNKVHEEEMRTYDCDWIDMVVTNFHPLDECVQQAALSLEEIIEQVDIGGTAMVRSAGKNFRYVTVVVNPDRYPALLHELRAHDGAVTFAPRFRLAQEAFAATARYDAVLA